MMCSAEGLMKDAGIERCQGASGRGVDRRAFRGGCARRRSFPTPLFSVESRIAVRIPLHRYHSPHQHMSLFPLPSLQDGLVWVVASSEVTKPRGVPTRPRRSPPSHRPLPGHA